MRRVVVTGIGCISPLAADAKNTWHRLLKSESGISSIKGFDTIDLTSRVAGQVKTAINLDAGSPLDSSLLFDEGKYISPKDRKKVDTFIVYGLAAATQAVEDSGWMPSNENSRERTGVIIGSGIGGLPEIYETSIKLHEQGARKVSPFFIPACLANMVSGHVSIKYGFKGPNHSVVTACATGSHAIGDAARLIQYGDADVMVAGGAEATVCRIGVAGFCATRALSTSFNDTPEKASRPWDKDRDGFVIGEGSAVLVLEEYEHAKARNAKIYAEVVGYGLSGDAFHITTPGNRGAARAMQSAIKNANKISGLNLSDIGYINAHGTSTPVGDGMEVSAVKEVFGDHADNLAISSTKSAIGHLLGAAGSMEALFSVLALQNNVVPPTLNLDNPDDDFDLNFVPHQPQEIKLKAVMSNSFGFGGTNACLIFKKI